MFRITGQSIEIVIGDSVRILTISAFIVFHRGTHLVIATDTIRT